MRNTQRPAPDHLITATDLARRLGVKTDTIRRWARAGRIPSYRVGMKTLRFEYTEVAAALQAPSDRDGGCR